MQGRLGIGTCQVKLSHIVVPSEVLTLLDGGIIVVPGEGITHAQAGNYHIFAGWENYGAK